MTVPGKRHAPAAERNKAPIAEVLARVLPARGLVLEVASGSGQHVVWFAHALPALTWQPSDIDPENLASIAAWTTEAALPNVRRAVALDAMAVSWPIERADAVICSNMIHIAPWDAAVGLFAGARRVLPAGGRLCVYGPFRFDGVFTAPSNEEFDRSLRARDPRWGVRDITELDQLAGSHALERIETIAMPANNHVLVFEARRP
ncbi:MAG: DUF938 domain-containing protein [Kofleriaceae bacterium]